MALPVKVLFLSGLLVGSTFGYEHKLAVPSQFIPYTSTVPRTTVVIGEQFTLGANNQINGVTGPIHFVTIPTGCRYVCPRTAHDWTGTWDLSGELLKLDQVAWPTPQQQIGTGSSTTPQAETNNEAIYAQGVLANGTTITTGQDTLFGYGYVDATQSHYTWSQTTVPAQNPPGYFSIPRTPPFQFQVSLTSDGDLPLNITSTVIQVVASGYYTNGTGTATYNPQPNDCLNDASLNPVSVASGTNCSIQITFDPSTIISTSSPYGYAYNVLFLSLASDAGNLPDWSVRFTITGFSPPDE